MKRTAFAQNGNQHKLTVASGILAAIPAACITIGILGATVSAAPADPDTITGWKNTDGEWYFYDSTGTKVTGWQHIGNDDYYFDENGQMSTEWEEINKKWYYFDEKGHMTTGWQYVKGYWYYLRPSTGVMETGWEEIDGYWYYFDHNDGDMATSSRKIGGPTYDFDSNGHCKSRKYGDPSTLPTVKGCNGNTIVSIAETLLGVPYELGSANTKSIDCSGLVKYCYGQLGITVPHGATSINNTSGINVAREDILPGDVICYDYGTYTGHCAIYVGNGKVIHASESKGKVLYGDLDMLDIAAIKRIIQSPVDGNGEMTNTPTWKKINGYWLYFDSTGSAAKEWELIGSTWYYFDDRGHMVTGWQEVDGKWYYMNSEGALVTGWKRVDGKWYYLDEAGTMATGLQTIKGVTYYFNPVDGNMLTGWNEINGIWYFMNSDGAAITGWKQYEGKWYYLDNTGAMITGWKFIGSDWYYLDSVDGYMVTGSKTINGITYNFDSNGHCTNPNG